MAQFAGVAIYFMCLMLLVESRKCPKSCRCLVEGHVTCSYLDTTPSGEWPPGTTSISMHFWDYPPDGLPPGLIRDLESIESVTISGKIGTIQKDSFIGLSGLTEHRGVFVIMDAQIATIDESAFFNLGNIDIQILRSQIGTISSNAFRQIMNMKRFFVSETIIEVLDAEAFSGFGDTPALQMEFHLTDITTVEPKAFTGVNNVQSLLFKNVDINTISPFSFDNVHNVDRITFFSCFIQSLLNHAFSGIHHVGELKFEYSRVKCIHQNSLINMTYMRHLEMQDPSLKNNFPIYPSLMGEHGSNTQPICMVDSSQVQQPSDCHQVCSGCGKDIVHCKDIPVSFPNTTREIVFELYETPARSLNMELLCRCLCITSNLTSINIIGRIRNLEMTGPKMNCPQNKGLKVEIKYARIDFIYPSFLRNFSIASLAMQQNVIKNVGTGFLANFSAVNVSLKHNVINFLERQALKDISQNSTEHFLFQGNDVICMDSMAFVGVEQMTGVSYADLVRTNTLPNIDNFTDGTVCLYNTTDSYKFVDFAQISLEEGKMTFILIMVCCLGGGMLILVLIICCAAKKSRRCQKSCCCPHPDPTLKLGRMNTYTTEEFCSIDESQMSFRSGISVIIQDNEEYLVPSLPEGYVPDPPQRRPTVNGFNPILNGIPKNSGPDFDEDNYLITMPQHPKQSKDEQLEGEKLGKDGGKKPSAYANYTERKDPKNKDESERHEETTEVQIEEMNPPEQEDNICNDNVADIDNKAKGEAAAEKEIIEYENNNGNKVNDISKSEKDKGRNCCVIEVPDATDEGNNAPEEAQDFQEHEDNKNQTF